MKSVGRPGQNSLHDDAGSWSFHLYNERPESCDLQRPLSGQGGQLCLPLSFPSLPPPQAWSYL